MTREAGKGRDKWDDADKPEPGSNRNYRPAGGNGPDRQSKEKRRRRSRDFKGKLLTSKEFMGTMRPPDWLIDGVALSGYVYTLTGNTGDGKTTIALAMVMSVATGGGFCGRLCKQGSVVFFAGENPDNVKMQWYALCAECGIDPVSLPVFWYEGPFDIGEALDQLADALKTVSHLKLCVVDSLQAFFTGEDDSQNMQMLDIAVDFRSMSEKHPEKPTCIILAHPVKNARKDALLPRGGSAITNELDGNLTVWRDDNIVTLHWHGKFRGAPFDPIAFEAVQVKPEGLVDAKGLQMSCGIVKAVMPLRAAEMIQQKEKREEIILSAIRANASVTYHELGDAIRQGRSTAQRVVKKMMEDKWIKKFGRTLVLTKEGNAVLDG